MKFDVNPILSLTSVKAVNGLKKELATAKKGFTMKTASSQDKAKVKRIEDKIAAWEAKMKK